MCIFSCNSYAMQGMKMQTWIILSHASKCKNMNNFHSVKPYATSQDLYSSSTEDIIFTPQPLTHIQAVFQNTWSLYHTCVWRPGYQVHTCACVCVWERIRIIFHMELVSHITMIDCESWVKGQNWAKQGINVFYKCKMNMNNLRFLGH